MTKEVKLQKQREWYRKNPGKYSEYNKKKRGLISEWLRELKETTPCMDCQQSYPYYAMDFDHRTDEEKLYEPHRLAKTQSWKKARAEVKKCDIVCANCHRMRTFDRQKQENRVYLGSNN